MAPKHYTQSSHVCVIVPCYNYGDFLKEAVESVINQTYKNISILIIDDGSTDTSEAVATALADKYENIKYIKKDNSGIVATRNLGIEQSRGEFIIFLDADDMLELNYIEETLKKAQAKDADIVYTNVRRFGEEDYVTSYPKFSLEELKNHNFIHISSLIRRSAVKDIRFDQNLGGMTHEDWDFFLNLCIHGAKAALCGDTHLNYRIHHSARNNRFGDFADQRKYVDVYAYVIDKYRSEFPKNFDYLTGRVFADWYAAIDDERITHQNENVRIASQRDVSQIKLYNAERELELITNSKKYKLVEFTSLLIHPKNLLKKVYRNYKKFIDKKRFIDKKNIISVKNIYNNNLKSAKGLKRSKATDLAVVIHLYYPDMWDEFQYQLSKLDHLNFDLFVSVPAQSSIQKEIKKSYPNAFIYTAPNRGRDVLPFLWIMQTIKSLGYTYVLKVHSKKSKHRQDGNKWFKEIIDTLIPEDKTKSEEIITHLSNPKAALIGPQQEYVSLEVNYEQNKHYFNKLLSDLKIDDVRKELHNFGFFAGTMFWARVDVFEEILSKKYGVADFQLESGQIDGTFAHGLERIFCVLPETKRKKIYSINSKSTLAPVGYGSGRIPEWSDLHAG